MKVWELILKLNDVDEDLEVLTLNESDGGLDLVGLLDVREATFWKAEGYVTEEVVIL